MFNKSEILFSEYTDKSIDVEFGRDVTPEYEEFVVNSFLSKGMKEISTLQKSAHSKVRTFTIDGSQTSPIRSISSQKLWDSIVKKNSKALDLADKLIKSLEGFSKAGEPNRATVHGGWVQDKSTGQMSHKIHGTIKVNKTPEGAFNVRHHGNGMAPDLGTFATPQEAGAKIKDHMNTLNGMKPAKMAPTVKSEEDDKELDKSNYGPKGMDQYNTVDNINRKANNVGDVAGEGPNTNVKAYSSKPGQLSAKAQAALEAARMKDKNKQQPVKVYSKEEIEDMNQQRALKKNAPEWSDDELANKLSSIIPFGQKANLQPTNDEFAQGMLNSGIAVTPSQVEQMNKGWGDGISDFFTEASKPISSRFASEEEELAFWDSIKIAVRDNSGSGY